MSLTTKVADTLRYYFTAYPAAVLVYSDVHDYLNTWVMNDSDEIMGVLARPHLRVAKTELENLFVFFRDGEPLGWCLGKDVKRIGQDAWEKRYPNPNGVSEVVWEIPADKTSTILRHDVKEILNYARFWLKNNPAAPKASLPPPPDPMTVTGTPDLVAVDPGIITPIEPEQMVLPEISPEKEAAILAAAAEEIRLKELGVKPAKKTRIKLHNVKTTDKVKKVRAPKVPKVKPDRSLRAVFKAHLAAIDIEKLKKPWMAKTDIRLIETPGALQAWVDAVLADKSRWRLDVEGNLVPIIAVDTETIGLDNRIIVDLLDDGSLVYEVKAEVAGVCLASHAGEGIYVPIHHDGGKCMSREDVARILQPLFDVSHLLFYNAKFDREILRICLGITCRPFPHFEDVQVLQYDNDPKADMDDQKKGKTFQSDAGGLKALSENLLGMTQIHLEELVKVKALQKDTQVCKCKHGIEQHGGDTMCLEKDCKCTGFDPKETMRIQHCPFNWLPTHIALWYAAADATCTWGLWEKVLQPARSRKVIHKVDHNLVDAITYIERQRFLIDTERHTQTVKWHQGKLRLIEKRLQDLAVENGWPVKKDDDGNILEQSVFNVNSTPQIGKFLFDIRGWKPPKKTEKGNFSVDADAMKTLEKTYSGDPFLSEYANYKRYVALHPNSLRYEPKDKTVRVYFRQNVVAGGRLSAQGGEFEKDGGFGLNPQGVKKPENNWTVKGRILEPDFVQPEDVETHEECDLHPTCFREMKGKNVKAKGIINNHIANYLGYSICLVPSCTSCKEKFGVLIEDGQLDSNEVLNLRCLFIAPPGWTVFSVDYSNIEMRAAANCSGEPKFINEFLYGEGDFHTLTAINVFPEYSDPNTSKERKKYLRGIAKIMNFALLYGGTESAIFENLKKDDPSATIEQAREMVQAYWEGVPIFKQFVDRKQLEAREGPKPSNEPKWDAETLYHHGDIVQHDVTGRFDGGKDHSVYVCLYKDLAGIKGGDEPENGNPNWIKFMRCVTAIGRVISFVSAMEAQGIHFPLPGEQANYKQYRKYKDNAEASRVEGNKEEAKEWEALAQRLWEDEATGVKNFIDWRRFFGKIQRVAVNTPLQGLAGDFMRMSLNKICEFATVREPLTQAIFRLHATIHDEIDFIVKNEYVPYIIPRITRLMKLRKLHAAVKWPVPIECDIEYGHSWDVAHHVTGDKDHKPDGWTKIVGLESYIPEFFRDAVPGLLEAMSTADEVRLAKLRAWFDRNTHTRAKNAVDLIFSAKDEKARLKAMTIAFQLHEYYVVDETPDASEALLETFEAWEARMGLGPKDRDPKYPPFGYLGAIPLNANIIRPELTHADDLPEPPAGGVRIEVVSEVQPVDIVAPEPPEPQQSLFTEVETPVPVLKPDLSKDEMTRLFNALGRGEGNLEVPAMFLGKRSTIKGCTTSVIPEEFLDKSNAEPGTTSIVQTG
jgi:DNA polymerase I-like protein with 3'-5' exonuclease and polymerase domains